MDGLPEPGPAVEIVVTARALPDPASEHAYSIERIGGTDLRNAPRTQLDEVLKVIPGLQLFRRSDSTSGHPTSQGITLRALGGNAASRVLVVLDGVPQSDPFGGWINWPAYDTASLAEVTVIRGGGSVTYGPGALAGVVDMVSDLTLGVGAGIDFGGRQSAEGRVRLAENLAGGTVNMGAHAARGDGFIPITEETRGPADRRAPYRETSLRGQWLGPIANKLDLQLSASGFIDRRDRGLAFTGNRTDGADAAIRFVGHGNWRWSALGYGQWREFESSFASVTPGRTEATRVSLQDSVPSHAFGGAFEIRPPVGHRLELRLGGNGRWATGESRELFAYVSGDPTRRRVAGGDALTAGAFGEMAIEFGRLTLSGGGGLDRWRISNGELREHVIATGATLRDDEYRARSGWLPTARLGATWSIGGGFTLRSAAYRGWRLPTLNELFRPFRAGADATAANPELDPEKLNGIEMGADFQKEGFTLSFTAFANRLKGAIANVTLGQGPGVFPGVGFVAAGGEYRQRQNLEAVKAEGLEASAELKRGPWLARAGLSLVDASVDGHGAASPLNGLRPAQTPRFSVTGTVGWERGSRAITLALRHVGNQYEDDLNQRKLPAATTVDAFAAWPIVRDLQLVLRGENLFGERVVAGIGGDGAIERAAPRTLWLGLRFNNRHE
ncbi:MAG: TonB-dependent receptor plug domain-containing protein [Sphingomicrobium sp.]